MPKLTAKELDALRAAKRAEWDARAGSAAQVVVGLGTCGIAAGAREAMAAFRDEIEKNNLTASVVVRQTGCMGLCYSEPTVEITMPDMPPVVYGKVDAEVARRIVRKHLIGRLLINDHIYEKPSADLLRAPAPKGS
jgi:NADP-reducing hydrogenase subunit HndB